MDVYFIYLMSKFVLVCGITTLTNFTQHITECLNMRRQCCVYQKKYGGDGEFLFQASVFFIQRRAFLSHSLLEGKRRNCSVSLTLYSSRQRGMTYLIAKTWRKGLCRHGCYFFPEQSDFRIYSFSVLQQALSLVRKGDGALVCLRLTDKSSLFRGGSFCFHIQTGFQTNIFTSMSLSSEIYFLTLPKALEYEPVLFICSKTLT